jgi:hypothetical protein
MNAAIKAEIKARIMGELAHAKSALAWELSDQNFEEDEKGLTRSGRSTRQMSVIDGLERDIDALEFELLELEDA